MEIKYSNQNNGETFVKLKVGPQNYTIRGYSRAGLKTSILIDEMNVVFDMGYSNTRAFSYDNKLISHGHNDHIGALHADHCARTFFNITKQRLYIMPKQCIKPFKIIATAVSEMNCGKSGEITKFFDDLLLTDLVDSESCVDQYYPLIGVTKMVSEYVVRSVLMDHKIKSFGYIIYRKSKKLKPEYSGLKGNEIIQLKKEIGEENLTVPFLNPLLAYTGDTTIYGIINNQALLNVPFLIMECTGFSPDDNCECLDGKHIHWNDLVNNYKLFKNEKIMLFHFSQQYKTIDDIIQYTSNAPAELMNKLVFFF